MRKKFLTLKLFFFENIAIVEKTKRIKETHKKGKKKTQVSIHIYTRVHMCLHVLRACLLLGCVILDLPTFQHEIYNNTTK